MHTEHAHRVFGNSLMSHLLDAAWHCLQAEKKRNQTCVYVCMHVHVRISKPSYHRINSGMPLV